MKGQARSHKRRRDQPQRDERLEQQVSTRRGAWVTASVQGRQGRGPGPFPVQRVLQARTRKRPQERSRSRSTRRRVGDDGGVEGGGCAGGGGAGEGGGGTHDTVNPGRRVARFKDLERAREVSEGRRGGGARARAGDGEEEDEEFFSRCFLVVAPLYSTPVVSLAVWSVAYVYVSMHVLPPQLPAATHGADGITGQGCSAGTGRHPYHQQ